MCACCRKDRRSKWSSDFNDEFSDKLDAWNIVQTQMNMQRFLSVFLTREQRLLLRHQDSHAIDRDRNQLSELQPEEKNE